MSKKGKKGEKVSLGEFLGPENIRALPSAPSARDPSESYDRRQGFGEPPSGGSDTWRRGPPGSDRQHRSYDDSNGPSRADEDSEWRKNRPQSGRMGLDAPRSAADDATEWRRKPMSMDRPMDRPTPPPSAADESTEWRRREPLRPEGPPPARSVADESMEWRRSQPPKTEEDEWKKNNRPSSAADEASTWRRKEPLRPASADSSSASAPPPSSIADNDNNWRKGGRPVSTEPETPPVPPKSAEVDDWRANRISLPPSEAKEKRAAPEADSIDDWRAASKFKKSSNRNNANSVKRKREDVEIDSEVLTPFGTGILIEERASDNVRVVKLDFGGKAFLRHDEVIAKLPKTVSTPYGKGKLLDYRFADDMCEIELEFGKAFIRLQDVLDNANRAGPTSNGSHGKKSSSGSGSRNRRFGDMDRDRERENAFAGMSRGERRGRDTPDEEKGESRPKSEVFAAFSSRKTPSAPPSVSGSGEDKSQAFSAFGSSGGRDSSQRMSREEKDRAFAPFSSQPDRGRKEDRLSGPPRAFSTTPTTPSTINSAAPPPSVPFRDNAFGRSSNSNPPSFPGFASRDPPRNSDSFPGFASRDSGRNTESFPGFGRRSADTSRAPPSVGDRPPRASSSRLSASDEPMNDQPPSIGSLKSETPEPAASVSAPAPADLISKTLPKGSKWGEDDEEGDESASTSRGKPQQQSAAASAKKITMETALNALPKIVKDYMIGEDRSSAISALGKLTTDNDQELFSTFVASLSAQAFAGTKQKKLVSGLLVEMSKLGALSSDVIVEGLTRTLEANAGDESKLATLKDIFAGIAEKTPSLNEVAPRGEGAKLRDTKKDGSTSSGKNVDDLATEVFQAGEQGVSKLEETKFASMPGASAALLRCVLKNAKLDEASCSWVDKNAKTLSKVLFEASESEQVKALETIQLAFNEIGFPKANNVALIDKVFFKLYNNDVLPDEAFLAWKDDLTLSAAGRDKAIIQTTNFFVTLEEADEEDDE